MNYSPIDDVSTYGERGDRMNDQFQLTPEEARVLKECGKEGIVNRGIPLGVLFGIGGLMAAKAGPLMSSKYGVKPAVIGLGFVGYFIGRLSYSRICMDRALQVPGGNLRRILEQKRRELSDPRENYYATIEPKHDPELPNQRVYSDIDIPTTSSFDTTPSEYYAENPEPLIEAPPQNYTSYDDLRRQNREEYSKKMYSDTVRRQGPSERSFYGTPQPQMRRRREEQPPEQSNGNRTKYGDVWDA